MATPGEDRGKVEKFSVYLTFDLIAFIWSLKLYIVQCPHPHLHFHGMMAPGFSQSTARSYRETTMAPARHLPGEHYGKDHELKK